MSNAREIYSEQRGQFNLEQSVDTFSRRYFFTLALKENFDIILLIWLLSKSFHFLGIAHKGNLLTSSVLPKGTLKSLAFRKLYLLFNSWLVAHMLTKDLGSLLFIKSDINWRELSWIWALRGSIFKSLNRGPVWALYLALTMHLIAFFCFLTKLSMLDGAEQEYAWRPYNRWQWNKE